MAKRRVFISYHHDGDQAAVNRFKSDFSRDLEAFTDASLDRKVNSDNVNYLNQVCRDAITGTSVTIVMIGKQTGKRKFVDWEIYDTLEKKHGLVAFAVPGITSADASVPERLTKNRPSGTGYAKWYSYPKSAQELVSAIEEAVNADTKLIDNTLARKMRNSQ